MKIGPREPASPGSHWIQGAVQHPGALHRALGVPIGTAIPAKKIAHAAQSDAPKLRRMAQLAETLRGFHHQGHRGNR